MPSRAVISRRAVSEQRVVIQAGLRAEGPLRIWRDLPVGTGRLRDASLRRAKPDRPLVTSVSRFLPLPFVRPAHNSRPKFAARLQSLDRPRPPSHPTPRLRCTVPHDNKREPDQPAKNATPGRVGLSRMAAAIRSIAISGSPSQVLSQALATCAAVKFGLSSSARSMKGAPASVLRAKWTSAYPP